MVWIDKLLRKKTKRTKAKIVSWVVKPEGSFPIFQFKTEDGEEISGVLTQKDILPLEAMPIAEAKKEKMINDLPVENVSVIYNIKCPYIFSGSYV